jgi:hypothetical protein
MLKPCSICDKYIALAPNDNTDLCRACSMVEQQWRNKIAKEVEKMLDTFGFGGYTFTNKKQIIDTIRGYHG